MRRPWCTGKNFDRSAPCGALVLAAAAGALAPDTPRAALADAAMTFGVNDAPHRQRTTLDRMIWKPDEIVAALSEWWDVKASARDGSRPARHARRYSSPHLRLFLFFSLSLSHSDSLSTRPLWDNEFSATPACHDHNSLTARPRRMRRYVRLGSQRPIMIHAARRSNLASDGVVAMVRLAGRRPHLHRHAGRRRRAAGRRRGRRARLRPARVPLHDRCQRRRRRAAASLAPPAAGGSSATAVGEGAERDGAAASRSLHFPHSDEPERHSNAALARSRCGL